MEGEITSSKSREALVEGSDKSCQVCQFGYAQVSFWRLPKDHSRKDAKAPRFEEIRNVFTLRAWRLGANKLC
jgi:hypothetical protein